MQPKEVDSKRRVVAATEEETCGRGGWRGSGDRATTGPGCPNAEVKGLEERYARML
jgi:hypothetical protein